MPEQVAGANHTKAGRKFEKLTHSQITEERPEKEEFF